MGEACFEIVEILVDVRGTSATRLSCWRSF
jgi:hypothetical protein